MKLVIGGGAALAGLMLATSILVIAKPLQAGVPAPRQIQQTNQTAQISTPNAAGNLATAEVNNNNKENEESAKEEKTVSVESVSAKGEVYSATAYSLPGHTASGLPVGRGVLAADPRILPLGTRVMISAGSYSGEYVIADTGTAIKGNRLDIWMPSFKEACRWGRRNVKLTVISYPHGKGTARKSVGATPIPVTVARRPRIVQ